MHKPVLCRLRVAPYQWCRRARAITRSSAYLLVLGLLGSSALGEAARGWLSWRGPEQTGVSREKGLPDKVSAQDALWTADFPGQSACVVANGKLYAMGYQGQG